MNNKTEYRIWNRRCNDFLGLGIIDIEACCDKAEVALVEQRNSLFFGNG